MQSQSTQTLTSPAVADQAAAWFARQRSGRWSRVEAGTFDEWLQATPAHRAAWVSYARLWSSLEPARDHPTILAMREDARLHAASTGLTGRAWRVGVAFAASALLATGIWWSALYWSLRSPNSSPQNTANAAASLIRDASTDIGERSDLVLCDGSTITLNTASAVHADYSGPERRVTLIRGEAYFDVAKDATRPFVVVAGPRQVIAVGTAFNVRLDDSKLRVTLVEGRVRVATAAAAAAPGTSLPPAASITLEAGSALVARDDGSDVVERADVTKATSWRSGNIARVSESTATTVTLDSPP